MAMLAEPKRRHQAFALQPRGKPLYEDSNNFGSKMLSKMGWEPGKGLGANEDGKLDFIKVKYKNDIQGIGFEARDDQWTQHEDGFNKLLQTLSNSNSQENSEDDEDVRPAFGLASAESEKKNVKYKASGESLEQKSKTSRTRVHYKKFTKGKDLSQYSEKDLANIFGKKVDNDETFTQIPTAEEPSIADDTFVTSIFTTTSSLSLTDYFKQKMNKKNPAPASEVNADTEIEKPKKKKKKDKFKDEEQIQDVVEETEEIVTEKKKKKKKQKEEFLQVNPTEEEVAPVEIEIQTKKKKKRKEMDELIDKTETTIEFHAEDVPAKKSKKRKHQDVETEVIVKSKKKKNKSANPEEPSLTNIQPNSLKKSEIEFNRIRAEQICSYLRNCQRLVAQTTLRIHPVTAEIIRNANISKFKCANIGQITGYGLTPDVGIDVLKGIKINFAQMLKETVTAENPNLIVF